MWELQTKDEETLGWLHSPYGGLQMIFIKNIIHSAGWHHFLTSLSYFGHF